MTSDADLGQKLDRVIELLDEMAGSLRSIESNNNAFEERTASAEVFMEKVGDIARNTEVIEDKVSSIAYDTDQHLSAIEDKVSSIAFDTDQHLSEMATNLNMIQEAVSKIEIHVEPD